MKLLSALRLILTLRCEESSRLTSEALDRKLSFAERWAVRLHHFICWSCRRLAKQLRFIRDAATQAGEAEPPTVHQLSTATRSRIAAAIRKQRGG